jgi:3-oxoacyl-[acyl-carrier protein] reductase
MENVLITGVSRGLGLVMAKEAIAQGYRVVGICRTMTQELINLQERFPSMVSILLYDLSNYKDIKTKIFSEFIADQAITAFINNAAKGSDTLLTNMDAEAVLDLTIVNQISPMLLTKYVIRNMLLHETKGRIIHISSVSAHTGYKGLAMYAATKGAIEAFSKSTAREWGSKGIRSNCIAAGFMNTDMTKEMTDEAKVKIAKRTSLKEATSEYSVAATALFLISSSSSSITGEVIHVDGGSL